MPNHSYYVEPYNAALQSKIDGLWVIGIGLLVVLISLVVYCIAILKEKKTKIFPYVQLICAVVVSVLLISSFSLTMISYYKDISEEAYIQYEGPATISRRRKVVLGNIPTWYNEYVVSFYNNGEQVTLSTRRDHETEGNIEHLYIVYAQNSGEILVFSASPK